MEPNIISYVKRFFHSHKILVIRYLKLLALHHKIELKFDSKKILITKIEKFITLDINHLPYVRDIIRNFEFYYSATSSNLKDYSVTKDQDISGFKNFPLLTPSIPEPLETVNLYLEILNLVEGDTVLDLGAYSGLSSIKFQERVGRSGKVVSVEADPENARCCEVNFHRFFLEFGYSPLLVNKAIWSEITQISFSAEHSLGSAVSILLPRAKPGGQLIQTTTLSEVAASLNLRKIDAIKADIEGAEYFAFLDEEFFKKFHPKIVFESAEESSIFTKSENIISLLQKYGYSCQIHEQLGSQLPLIVCV
jgi:FkbM family methyltransferase